MFKFNNGDELRDRVSGFKGVVECRMDWLNGCKRYSLTPKVGKDGKRNEGHTFDEEQLELVTAGKVTANPKPTGGGRADPRRRDDVASR